VNPLRKESVLNLLKVLILLLPLPFGCVGRFFNPLFSVVILIFSWLALSVKQEDLQVINTDLKLKETLLIKRILHQRQIFLFLNLFILFMVLQLIPLPRWLVETISPHTLQVLSRLQESELPRFLSLSLVPPETLVYLLKFLVIVIFIIALFRIRMSKGDITSLINTLILSASIQAIFGLTKYALGNERFFLLFGRMESPMTFLTGTLGNPDHFAFWMEMTIPLVMAMFFLRIRLFEGRSGLKQKMIGAVNENWRVILYLLVFALLGTAVVLSGSRSGIVAMVISLVLFAQLSVYFSWTRQIRRKMKYLLIALSLVIIFVGAQDTVHKFLQTGDLTEGGRFIRWPNTISLFMDFPLLGSGFGTYRYAFFPYDQLDKWSRHAHNDYLEILAEGGLLGGFIFLGLVTVLMTSFIRMWARRRHPQMKILGNGILCALFVAVFHSLLDFSLRIPSNVLILSVIFLLGLKVVTYKKEFSP